MVDTTGRFADASAFRSYGSLQLAEAHALHLNAGSHDLLIGRHAGGIAQQRVVGQAGPAQAEPVIWGGKPAAHRSIPGAAGDQAAIGAERHRPDPILMALEGGADRRAALRVPQPHRSIIGAACDHPAIGAEECKRIYRTLVALEGDADRCAACRVS